MLRPILLLSALAVTGCATAPLTPVPTAGLQQKGSVEEVMADCDYESKKISAPIQNFGLKYNAYQTTYNACLRSRGYERVSAGPGV